MKILSRQDVVSAVITGLTTGLSAWLILDYLGASIPLVAPSALVILLPVLWPLGVQLGYALGVLWKPLTTFGRFAAIGFANAAVDFGILYLLIEMSGKTAGFAYTACKAFSFAVATVHSYLWNKHWTFGAGQSRGGKGELGRFVAVSVVSLLLNASIATAVVALRPVEISAESWAGISAGIGSAVALTGSFVGFRVFVFRKT